MTSNFNVPKRIALVLAIAAAVPAAHAAPPAARALAVQQAQGLLSANRSALKADSEDVFEARDAVVDRDGVEHVRFDRHWRGMPVIGGDVVATSARGRFAAASLTLRSALRPTGKARLSKDDAAVEAGSRFHGRVDKVYSNQAVVYARGAAPVLAYEVILSGAQTDAHSGLVKYYVDAASGKVLDVQDLVQTAAAVGTGKSLYYGDLSIATDQKSASKFDLIDTTRGNGAVHDAQGKTVSDLFSILFLNGPVLTDTDNVWGNNSTSDRNSVGVDIHYGVGVTWDYYKNVHSRTGLSGDGKGIKSYAHTTFKTSTGAITGANAAYVALTNTMFYGDGDAARGFKPVVGIDVAGHEMTHGVTAKTAALAYSGDAGGLNESASDIFGTLVEFYANNANDPGDYRIGEMVRTEAGKALRDMYNQAADGKSFNCYPAGGFDPNLAAGGIHDPHYTSGVGNRFFYLLAEGAVVPAGSGLTSAQLVCNGDTAIAGIGRDKAGKIFYRALTTKFTSNTTYPQARTLTLQAAAELYGAGSPEHAAVARAWSGANVN
ncbi:Zn-dependent metalloprotease [Lysobacter sp. yr284]|uniref:M4 family metallopeptidase n=1 Tax=Lysobacter sp. yr284 TaxID=1761791 RepID=UPI00089CF577|nr:M4 family metallopeptidase [Lysobacter sp. yr284]SDZ08852.1 Zn-dependent metalloprotease [Lysobacter sp. yr284]